MRNRPVVLGGLAAAFVVILWWFVIFSGVRSESGDVGDDIAAAQREKLSLDQQLEQLESLESRGPETEAELDALKTKLPTTPDLASFIDQATAIGDEAGVVWVSVSPADPMQVASVATVSMTIEVDGGYFQVLDYLRLLEELPRLVVVDGVSLAASEGGETSDAVVDATAAPDLRATLTARMFALSAVSAAAPGESTTTTTVGVE